MGTKTGEWNRRVRAKTLAPIAILSEGGRAVGSEGSQNAKISLPEILRSRPPYRLAQDDMLLSRRELQDRHA